MSIQMSSVYLGLACSLAVHQSAQIGLRTYNMLYEFQ